jgi:hypothetical protein
MFNLVQVIQQRVLLRRLLKVHLLLDPLLKGVSGFHLSFRYKGRNQYEGNKSKRTGHDDLDSQQLTVVSENSGQ